MTSRDGFVTDWVSCEGCQRALAAALVACASEGCSFSAVVLPGPFRIAGQCSTSDGGGWYAPAGLGRLVELAGPSLCHDVTFAYIDEPGNVTRFVARPGSVDAEDVGCVMDEVKDGVFVLRPKELVWVADTITLARSGRGLSGGDQQGHSWLAKIERRLRDLMRKQAEHRRSRDSAMT